MEREGSKMAGRELEESEQGERERGQGKGMKRAGKEGRKRA
jgi:hypothetical protein